MQRETLIMSRGLNMVSVIAAPCMHITPGSDAGRCAVGCEKDGITHRPTGDNFAHNLVDSSSERGRSSSN